MKKRKKHKEDIVTEYAKKILPKCKSRAELTKKVARLDNPLITKWTR